MLLLATFVFASCNDDFDRPPMNIPVAKDQANMTILQLKEKYWSSDKNSCDSIVANENGENAVIKGRVTSSDATGNIYQMLTIQDETASLVISIKQSSLYTTYRVGQEVVIPVTGLHIGNYNNLQQLGAYATFNGGPETSYMTLAEFQSHAELNGLPDPTQIDTVTTTIAALPTTPDGMRKMQGQLVKFDNVSFDDANGVNTYANPVVSGQTSTYSTNRTISDLSGNKLTVRNSGYATFRGEKLPKGHGSVVGILTYYGSAWQMVIRSTSDCIGFVDSSEGTSVDDPYMMDKVIAMQGTGKGGWMTGYIVGAVAPEISQVKSNSDIQWGAPALLANTIVIGATADTKDIKNCVVVELKDNTDLRKAANLKDNASAYQKQIWINASSFANVMGTYGLITTGAKTDFKLEGGDGTGTKDAPFTVSQVIAKTATGTGKWVKGYIVGWVDGMTLASGAKFTVPATSVSNVLIAATPTVTSVDECIPVQLPSGSAARSAVNLQDNPTNLGKQVSLCGDILAYFGATGLKAVTDYVLEGGTVTPPVDNTPVTTLNETFASGIPTNWIHKMIQGNKDWYATKFANTTTGVTDYYAAMTGYKGTAPFESWLITPALNVKDAATKILSFDNQVNGYGSTTTKFEVFVLSSNDPTTAKRTQLTPALATAPASGYSGWTNSGKLDLSSYGDQVYIGFRYTATADANFGTWCVTNVKFGL